MPFTCFVSVEGEKQGKFKGEPGLSKLAAGKISVIKFSSAVVSPTDAASGLPTGKRQHKAIEFVKELNNAASPQFFQALTQNETLKTVLFEFVATTPAGEEVVSYTIKLTNARVTSSEVLLDRTERGKPFDAHELQRVTLTFEKIEHEDKQAKLVANDDWVTKS